MVPFSLLRTPQLDRYQWQCNIIQSLGKIDVFSKRNKSQSQEEYTICDQESRRRSPGMLPCCKKPHTHSHANYVQVVFMYGPHSFPRNIRLHPPDSLQQQEVTCTLYKLLSSWGLELYVTHPEQHKDC